MVVVRKRVWEPPPQVAVQVDQADQSDCSQSTGHESSLQLRVPLRLGQTTPAWLPLVVTVRERVWEPEPQDLEHSVQADQADTSQSTGQGPSLHC